MPKPLRLIAYVGRGLGSAPQTFLRGGTRHVTWNTTDKRVRRLPEEDAASLLLTNPANFRPVVMASDVTATAAQIAEVVAAGQAHAEVFRPSGADPVDVFVIDDPAALAVLAPTSDDTTAKPKKKGK
jgi:hypothetical protein